jgi:hypothetical protein
MYLTRWVDWDRLVRMERAPARPAGEGAAGA